MAWKEFRITDIFTVKNTHSILQEWVRPGGKYPYVTAAAGNNSIVAYVDYDESCLEEGNCICIGGKTMVVTYQPNDFISNDSHNLVLYINDKQGRTESAQLFMVACLQKSLGSKYHWGDSISKKKIQSDVVSLPCSDDGSIDYGYMAERISELEAERISELEAYFIAAGLNDYELTDDDKEILSLSSIRPLDEAGRHEAPSVVRKEMQEFRVAELFDGKTGDVDLQTRDIDGKGEYFVNSGVQNQGIKGRTSRSARTFPAGTITVDFFGNAYLRDFKFKMATHNHVFALIEKVDIPHDAKLYITGVLGKLAGLYSFNNMLTWTILKDVMISLPVDENGEPDFEYMAAYIRVQKKLAIAEAVRLKDRIIVETGRIVA